MPFAWVRRIEQRGDWNELPVTLRLSASRVGAFGYAFVLIAVLALITLPIAAAVATAVASTEPGSARVTYFGWGRLLLAGAIGVALLAWALVCCHRALLCRPEIEIGPAFVEMRVPGLLAYRTTRTPLTAFDGLAVIPQSSLSGRTHGLYLLHPDRRLSPLLAQALVFEDAEVQRISRALGAPVVADATFRALETGSAAPRGAALAAA